MLIIAPGRRQNRDIFSIYVIMKVHCGFFVKSPYQSDSNEYTQYTIFNIKKENHPNFQNLQLWNFPRIFKNKFETAVVNEPSVFKPLKFYCIHDVFDVTAVPITPWLNMLAVSIRVLPAG